MNRLLLSLLLFTNCVESAAPESTDFDPVDQDSANEEILVVLNKSDNTASIVDLATGSTLSILPTGIGPHEGALSPDGSVVVVTNYGIGSTASNSLTVIDLIERKVTRTIDLGNYQRPHGIVFLPNGEDVWVTVEINQALIRVNLASGTVTQNIATGQVTSHMVAMLPDASRAFVANIGSGTVTAIDLVAGAKLTDITTGAGAEGIDVTPDGTEVWVTNRSNDTVSIIDADIMEVLATLTSAIFPIRVKITPDGAFALVSNLQSGEVAVIGTSSREEVARIDMNAALPGEPADRTFSSVHGTRPAPIGLLVHPGGQRFYVATPNVDRVMVVAVGSWTVVGRIVTGDNPDGMVFAKFGGP